MKEMKILRLVFVSIALLILFGVMLGLVIHGYLIGDMLEFGRHRSGHHEVSNDPEGFWYNFIAWVLFFVFSATVLIKAFIKHAQKIKNS
ncbi:hypothetical protein [Halioxenophilus sp. WMMB6]|uniref:hypothetical protein n=1 Tax=Halioxenophilus sp. WMMB6 TaxID=3073815 RepID=UPI00295EB6CD|nr:hypothetical protein [Halioxenophilus sp. WMMB6]